MYFNNREKWYRKSILLKHLIGLMRPDSGQISIDDKIINQLTFKDLQKFEIKLVWSFNLVHYLIL